MTGKRFANVNIKIVSLLMAILLEVYFYSPDNSLTIPLAATVEVLNVPSDLVQVSPESVESGIPIRIDVRGPRPLIEQIRGANYHFTVNYPGGRPLAFHPILDLKQMWLPVGVEVIGISPADLKVEFEPEVSKEVPVALPDIGRPREGFLISRVTITPESVRIRGPQKRLDMISEIRAQKFDVADLAENKEFEDKLLLPEGLVRISSPTAKFSVEVMKIENQSTFEPVNIKLLSPYGFAGTVEPSRAKVVLAGAPELLSGLSAKNLEVQADARNLSEGSHQIKLKGEFPQGVFMVSSDPEFVLIKLKKKGSKESSQ